MTEIDRGEFIYEMNRYCISDLELIFTDQKDLYTAEEMQLIEKILENKKQENKKSVSEVAFGEALFCLVSILTPIVGLIVGIIMLAAGSPRWKEAGKRTLFAVFISVFIKVFLYSGGFRI